jgi:Family of unknown function (DUF6328)
MASDTGREDGVGGGVTGRDETLDERLDRNWSELLQELRVTQTGTQIFTGFLLTIAFQQRFSELTPFQHRVYLILVVAAVLTTALGLAPVSLHRSLFRQRARPVIVQTAHVILRVVLVGVGVILSGTMLLIFDVAVGPVAGWIAGGVTLVIVVVIAVLPALLRLLREPLGPEL